MKFIVSSSQLLKQLQHINGVINANTVLPILEDFLFEVANSRLTVVATDLETVMRIQMDVEAREAGRVAAQANARRLLLTHLSSRHDTDFAKLLAQAKEEYSGQVEVASDGLTVELPLRE